jgi:hypothetical protein
MAHLSAFHARHRACSPAGVLTRTFAATIAFGTGPDDTMDAPAPDAAEDSDASTPTEAGPPADPAKAALSAGDWQTALDTCSATLSRDETSCDAR